MIKNMSSSKKKKTSIPTTAAPKEDEEDFQTECESIYLSVFSALEEEITSSEELILLLQYAGCNPSKKTVEKYWGPSIDSYDFRQFCAILRQEEKTSKKDLIKAFQKIDQNRDGFITHDELYQILTKRGERMTKTEVKAMIEDADFNGDGKLDYEEFCDLMDSTLKQCKNLYISKYERNGTSAKSHNSKVNSVKDKRNEKKHSIREEKKAVASQKPRQSSIISKLSNKEESSKNDSPEDSQKSAVQHLKTEPHDLSKWHFHMMKGCFYKEEDGTIESLHYRMKISQPTSIWITIKAAAPKYGRFNDAILETDMTVFLMESNSGKLIAFTNSIIDGKNCLQAEVNIGVYDILTFSTGCKLNENESSSGAVGLIKGVGDDAKLTKPCKDALLEIFYRCDLDGNGYLSHEEFNEFQMKSSGEGCDDESWDVVKETIEVTPQFEMTANGFLNLNTMEARDPEGGQDELWVTLDSMGYSKKLLLTKACPFQIEIFTKRGKNSISLLGVSDGGEPLKQLVNESITLLSKVKAIKGKRDLNLHIAEFVNRVSLAVENQSHSLVGIRLDCSNSENYVSSQATLDHVEDIPPKTIMSLHHLVEDRKGGRTKLRYQESVLR